MPKDEAVKVLPDGTFVLPPSPTAPAAGPVVVETDGSEIIQIEGEIQEVALTPIDNDTGLPSTGIDIITGLPVPLPENVPFIDPVTGKKNVIVDEELG